MSSSVWCTLFHPDHCIAEGHKCFKKEYRTNLTLHTFLIKSALKMEYKFNHKREVFLPLNSKATHTVLLNVTIWGVSEVAVH